MTRYFINSSSALNSTKIVQIIHSLYNNQELQIILSLVRKLLQGDRNVRAGKFKRMHPVAIDDIGIISPYKRQCRNIVSACKHNGWPDIKVGSVEIFQGQEKPVIIVSTVRSQMETIGFLNNWRVSLGQLE